MFELAATDRQLLMDSDLPVPLDAAILKDQSSWAARLGVLLQQGKREEFYQQAKQALDEFRNKRNDRQELDEKEKHDFLWLFYWVAQVRLLVMDSDEDVAWARGSRDLDYDVKRDALGSIAISWFDSYFPDDKQTRRLRATYAAVMIRDFLGQYRSEEFVRAPKDEPDEWSEELNAKQYAIRVETAKNSPFDKNRDPDDPEYKKECMEWQIDLDRQLQEPWVEYNNKRTKYVAQSSRNSSLKGYIAPHQHGEKSFVQMLVRLFPDSALDVRKYLLEAGYGKDELDGLIDRTVGRSAETEFLYKGNTGRRHDKRVRKRSMRREVARGG